MSLVARTAVVVTTLSIGAWTAPAATAEPAPGADAAGPEVLHNVKYRARIDGASRGATIDYAAQDGQTVTANPTMVPGRVFEVYAVLPATEQASIRVAVQWPYSANLHCEILVDDATVAQADDFVAPRLIPNRDDPDFGSITCAAPVGGVPVPPAVAPAPPPSVAPVPPTPA